LDAGHDHYRNDEFRKAHQLAAKAAEEAKRERNFTQLVESLLLQMNCSMSLDRIPLAKKLAERAVTLAAEKCSPEIQANALLESGYLHLQFLEYACAEEQTATALILARENNLAALQADALVQLAELDRLRGRHEEALVFLRSAMRLADDLDTERARLETLQQQALTFGAMGRYVAALEALEQIEFEAKTPKLTDMVVESVMYQGDIYRAVGDFDYAERLYDKALDLSDRRKLPTKTPDILKRVGTLLLHRRDYTRALEWYGFAEKEVRKFRSERLFPFIYLGYATALNGLENYREATDYLWKALDLIAPDYMLHSELLSQILDQFSHSLTYLNEPAHAEKLTELARRVRELARTGIDSSHQVAMLHKTLIRDLDAILTSIEDQEISFFTQKGVRVDLNTGEVYTTGHRPTAQLSDNQLAMFRLLVKHQGHPVTNEELIATYQERAGTLYGLPRRAHYYIAEIRKKLGRNDIIKPVRGVGYVIPRA
jgi:tetratricopeptide (TPR) repeat protein